MVERNADCGVELYGTGVVAVFGFVSLCAICRARSSLMLCVKVKIICHFQGYQI